MEPKSSGPLHPQNCAHAHVVPIFRATDGTPHRLPASPLYPHATYGGDAAAVGQSRLGQALPGEKSSIGVKKRAPPQQPQTLPPRPTAYAPSIPYTPSLSLATRP